MAKISYTLYGYMTFTLVAFVLVVFGYDTEYEWFYGEIKDADARFYFGLYELRLRFAGTTSEDNEYNCDYGQCDQDTLESARWLAEVAMAFAIASFVCTFLLVYVVNYHAAHVKKLAAVFSILLLTSSISSALSVSLLRTVIVDWIDDSGLSNTIAPRYGVGMYVASAVLLFVNFMHNVVYNGLCACCFCEVCKQTRENPLLPPERSDSLF